MRVRQSLFSHSKSRPVLNTQKLKMTDIINHKSNSPMHSDGMGSQNTYAEKSQTDSPDEKEQNH